MRVSRYIHYNEALKIIEAFEQASQNRTPWNFRIDIVNLKENGIDDGAASEWARKSLTRLKGIHNRMGYPFTGCWVLENGKSKGVHLHVFLFKPEGNNRDWRPYRKKVLRAFQVHRGKQTLQARLIERYPSRREAASRRLNYMLKGTRVEACPSLGTGHKDQGEVIGKRCGAF
jgi:hypothetical protein